MRKRAFSLVELLIVVAIVLLLMALVMPVFLGAKEQSKAAPCRSNLRQLHMAWSLYRSAHEEAWPSVLEEFAATSLNPILKCPADGFGGANQKLTQAFGAPVSYFYLRPLRQFRDDLLAADDNPGILYCVVHGQRTKDHTGDPVMDTTGTVLRARLDGSVLTVSVMHLCSKPRESGFLRGRPEWILLTEKRPCPEPWCLAASEECE